MSVRRGRCHVDVSVAAGLFRQVIVPRPGEPPELELYPISVRLLRHHLPPQPRPAQGTTTFTDVMGNIGGMMMREWLCLSCGWPP